MKYRSYKWHMRVKPYESAYHELIRDDGKVVARVTNFGPPAYFHYAVFDQCGVSRRFGHERTLRDAKTMVGLT